jgi:hypothetical protein
MQLIVREWKEIYPEMEFRAFVFDNEMTGCTQYYDHVRVRSLQLRLWLWLCYNK